jgi:cbb3-type cytochrome oxidase maturation protein
MDILYLLIPVSVVIVLAIGAIFWWAIASGQFDELDREGESVVKDDEPRPEHKR